VQRTSIICQRGLSGLAGVQPQSGGKLPAERVPEIDNKDAQQAFPHNAPSRGCASNLGSKPNLGLFKHRICEVTVRNHQLDGLRGVAAMAVIFYHAILHADVSLVDRVLYVPFQDLTAVRDIVSKLFLMIFDGEAAVMIFFVLSGFVLHLSLQREQTGSALSISTRFAIHRLFRILPAVIACMVAAYLLSRMFGLLGLPGFPEITADQLWRNALLVQITIHGPSGSVQTELAAIPILLACFFIARRFGSFALLLCFLFTIIQMQHPILIFRYANLWPNASAFVGGMLLALPGSKSAFARAGPGTVIASLCFFLVCRHLVPGQSISALIAQTLCCIVLVGAVGSSHGTVVNSVLESRGVHFLGRVSFSLYLLNVLVLFCLWSVPWLSTSPAHAVETGLLVGIVALVITVPFAYASERWIERPGVSLGKKLAAWTELRPAHLPVLPVRPAE
jgi:peptidoglycan/LPS O-acetylase OafA/YrhL